MPLIPVQFKINFFLGKMETLIATPEHREYGGCDTEKTTVAKTNEQGKVRLIQH